MNRKISTLFTAGLLMAGALCGSAWAQSSIQQLAGFVNGQGTFTATPATELKAGSQYVLVDATSNEAYGHELSGSTIQESTVALSAPLGDNDDVKKYVWTVSVTESPKSFFSYNFTNVETGKLLRINSGFTGVEKNTKVEDKNANKDFVFDVASATTLKGGVYAGTSNDNLYVYSSASPYNGLSWANNVSTVSTTASAPIFYEVKSEMLTDAEELNALYNTSGFSFVSKRLKDQGEEPIGNLFNEKMVVARYLASPITIDATQYPGYSGSSSDLQIPAGMYFFTENAPDLAPNGQVVGDYNAWLNATALVVSSTETMEGTNAGRANGDGFALAEMKISDLNLYVGSLATWKTQGDQTSIFNACFRVQKSYVEAFPYELNLDHFRFRVQGSKADHKDAQIKLETLQHNDNFYLTTISNTSDKTDKFIFKLSVAGTKKGIELLNTEAKAAIYTIRVLGGDKGDITSVYGKYLTSAVVLNSVTNKNEFKYVAKAKVLSQTETPAYQWAITSVDDTYSITFTNRETGEHFTTSLFPKPTLGENVYETAGQSADVTAIYVDENTYRETTGSKVNLKRLLVELTKVEEVDPYAGFLNVDDKTLVTMAFARDNNETSNKWYAAVTEETSGYLLNKDNKFADNVSAAAQWQLIKDESPKTIIESSFVYNRGNHVTVQAKGDKAYAYAYQLRYINDGIETNSFFPQGTNGYVQGGNAMVASNAAKFVIKQAVDGSVYLIPVSSTNANVTSVFNKDTKSVVEVEYDSTNDEYKYVVPSSAYAWPVSGQDWMLKTYLIEEAPEISYPAKEGHISLVSELGNYISMNEDHEGIVVNNEQFTFYLQVSDTKAVVPSFFISKGVENADERLFLFNPQDSVSYYVAEGKYDKKYQWAENANKAIFKAAELEANKDTLSTIVKGNKVKVATKADDEGVLGGLENFKVQIIQSADAEDMYVIRSLRNKAKYLYGINDKLAWGTKSQAMKFTIAAGDPTSNESIADGAAGVKVIGGNGIVEIQGAAGKKVVISNILGKVVAETILTSDNATIAVPAGIIAVAVDGENAVKTIVK